MDALMVAHLEHELVAYLVVLMAAHWVAETVEQKDVSLVDYWEAWKAELMVDEKGALMAVHWEHDLVVHLVVLMAANWVALTVEQKDVNLVDCWEPWKADLMVDGKDALLAAQLAHELVVHLAVLMAANWVALTVEQKDVNLVNHWESWKADLMVDGKVALLAVQLAHDLVANWVAPKVACWVY